MIKKVIKFLLMILWMGLIFSFSNDSGSVSTKKSDGLIINTIEIIIGRDLSAFEKEKWVNYLVVPVRKGAHIGIYFILGILIVIFISEFINTNFKSMFWSSIIAFLYACSDEFHQLLIPGRSGQLSDIFLDTLGAIAGIVIFLRIVRMCSKNEQKERIS